MRLESHLSRVVWLAMASTALATSAVAQSSEASFDAHGLALAGIEADPRDGLLIRRPGAARGGDYYLAALSEFAVAPLLLATETEDGQVSSEPVVDNLVALNLAGGVHLHSRLRLDLSAPIYLVGTTLDGTIPPSFGDLRAGGMISVLQSDPVVGRGGFGLGLVGTAVLPTGAADRYLGSGGFGGEGGVSLTGEIRRLTVSAQGLAVVSPDLVAEANMGLNHAALTVSVGALMTDDVGVTLEATARPAIGAPADLPTSLPVELIASARGRSGAGLWAVGAAAGVTDSPGVPTFRAFVGAGIGRAVRARAPDSDTLGVFTSEDRCPDLPETINGYLDSDGCPDELAPLVLEVQFRGAPHAAALVIKGPGGEQAADVGISGLDLQAVPGASFEVDATAPCLQGYGEATASAQGETLSIELTPDYAAHVGLSVTDGQGEMLPSATVIWTSETPDCVPAGSTKVSSFGSLEQDVGVGTHQVSVTAPGFGVFERTLTFTDKDNQSLDVVLSQSRVKIEDQFLQLDGKVQFETGLSVIKPLSYPLLDELAATISTHPELGLIEVGGHTDSKGTDTLNLKLSNERALAVREYLIGPGGVLADRVVARGYGESTPIDTNRTEEGRETNRRVEFKLLDGGLR